MAEARTLVPGVARAPALVLDEPMSFWGGVDPATGDIVDVHHPQRGARVAGVVLVMPGGRGSSSSSTVLAEAARAGTAPAAIVLREPDPILVLGAIVARELYGTQIPVVVASVPLTTGGAVRITATAERATIELL
jgi:predicted aconitase with swiveling domain